MKIVLFLDTKTEKQLREVSSLMARDPQRQAYIILKNCLDRMKGDYSDPKSENEVHYERSNSDL